MFRMTSKWLIAKFQTNVVQHIGLYSEQLVLYTLAQMLRMEELNGSDGRVGSDGRWFGWMRGKWFGWICVKWFGWMWKCTAKCIMQTVVFLCYMCRSTKHILNKDIKIKVNDFSRAFIQVLLALIVILDTLIAVGGRQFNKEIFMTIIVWFIYFYTWKSQMRFYNVQLITLENLSRGLEVCLHKLNGVCHINTTRNWKIES